MIRSVLTVVAIACSVVFAGSAHAQPVASLAGEQASFFERLFGGPVSPTARRLVAWSGAQRPGTIVISTSQRRLYFVLGNGQAIQYGVGVGRPGFTWTGTKTVSMKREWPTWSPPAAMLRRRPRSAALHARWPGQSVRCPGAVSWLLHVPDPRVQ